MEGVKPDVRSKKTRLAKAGAGVIGQLPAQIALGEPGSWISAYGGQVAVNGKGILGRSTLVLDALEDLFAMDRNRLRCIHADAHLVALDAEDRHGHFLV